MGAFTILEPDAAVAGRFGASFVILEDVCMSILFKRRLLGPLGDSGAAVYAEEEKWTTSVSINASDFWLAPLRPWIYKISLNLISVMIMMNGPCIDFADPHASVTPAPSWSIVYCETSQSLSMCMVV